MPEDIAATPAPRRRRRTRGRRIVDQVLLILGVPLLIFSLVALSAGVIENRQVAQEERTIDMQLSEAPPLGPEAFR